LIYDVEFFRFRSPGGTAAASGANGAAAAAASRRRRRRIISSDDSSMSLIDPAGLMSASELARSEAMMEGTRLLMDSLREKVAILEDKCEKLDREKVCFVSVTKLLYAMQPVLVRRPTLVGLPR